MPRKPPTGSRPPSRMALAFTLALVIGAGLASRRYGDTLPPVVASYAGDTLWALAAFVALRLCWPAARPRWIVVGAACIALGVELSQLAHPAWLETVRRWPGARLLLGYGFLASDLVCYAAGIVLGIVLDRAIATPFSGKPAGPQ